MKILDINFIFRGQQHTAVINIYEKKNPVLYIVQLTDALLIEEFGKNHEIYFVDTYSQFRSGSNPIAADLHFSIIEELQKIQTALNLQTKEF
jgi:urate oxidase